MNEDLHTLSGAYALHALPPRDEQLFEEHLDRCEACDIEVRGLRETAARLALGVAEAPPAAMRARVLAQISEVRQLPPLFDESVGEQTDVIELDQPAPQQANVVPLAPRQAWRSRVAIGLAALSTAAAVALGVVVLDNRQVIDDLRARDQQVVALLAAPDSETVHQPITAGGTATMVLSRQRGELMFTAAGLPELPAGKSYELWAMSKGGIRPAGLLGQVDDRVMVDLHAQDEHLGLTVEPEGGSQQPTTEPILFAKL